MQAGSEEEKKTESNSFISIFLHLKEEVKLCVMTAQPGAG